MLLQSKLEQSQKLIMTSAMQQSLKCLQMPIDELCKYLQDASLSNPFLELEEGWESVAPPSESAVSPDWREAQQWIVRGEGSGEKEALLTGAPQSYSEYLNEQLGLMRGLDRKMRTLCRYIVGCLNTAGYLACPLEEIAAELGVSLFDAEQALFVVQSLEPLGTGARSLSECLILQLAQSREFDELTLHIAQSGLVLLSQRNFTGLARMMHTTVEEVRHAADIVRRLNPIPSQGFYTGNGTAYIMPEAEIRVEDGAVLIELNRRDLPSLHLNSYYCSLVGDPEYEAAQPYLKERLLDAKSTLSFVEDRGSTLRSLLATIADLQTDFFLRGEGLLPMTMQQVADRMGMNVSTVSRAVKDKYILFNGHLLSIRSLFTSAVPSLYGEGVSADVVKGELKRFVDSENPLHPLSDAALCKALEGIGILISRRTISKYRIQLGIPAASERKKYKT